MCHCSCLIIWNLRSLTFLFSSVGLFFSSFWLMILLLCLFVCFSHTLSCGVRGWTSTVYYCSDSGCPTYYPVTLCSHLNLFKHSFGFAVADTFIVSGLYLSSAVLRFLPLAFVHDTYALDSKAESLACWNFTLIIETPGWFSCCLPQIPLHSWGSTIDVRDFHVNFPGDCNSLSQHMCCLSLSSELFAPLFIGGWNLVSG